jgi:diguanylate cyclase (GGDEF)-like protein
MAVESHREQPDQAEPEDPIMGVGDWSTEELAEFLGGISVSETEEAAIQSAVERAAEVLKADSCVYVRNGEIAGSIGLPDDPASALTILALVDGNLTDPAAIEAADAGHTLVVPVVGELGSHLVLTRSSTDFKPSERALVRAMGGALSLTMGKIQTLRADEERWNLLSRLSLIQRSLSHHAPLQEVLDAISIGARELLEEEAAAVVLLDSEDPDRTITPSVVGLGPDARDQLRRRALAGDVSAEAIRQDSLVVVEDFQSHQGVHPYLIEAGIEAAIAAPVRENGTVVGALVVASMTVGRRFSIPEQEALTAFADHASLALTDARLSDQVERALHDTLTGLPNRSLLTERLAERLDAGSPEVAVIFLDLDSFRSINDRVGHRSGDQVLIEVGRRLRECAGPEALVARTEGNTFALVSPAGDAQQLARKILEAVAEPFEVAGRELRTTTSIGIVDSGTDAEQMLRDADLAMYRAKSDGGARVVTFESSMHTERVRRLELQDDLARALGDEEIQPFFQPKVDLRSARVIGVEALVRWAHPERGLVAPSEFLDLAEAGGQMRALTERVIEFSVRVAGDWWRSGLGLQLSVNLSPLTFSEHDWRLDEFVADALASSGLPGSALQFEVTEDALMTDPEVAAEILERLSELGITISIDDFGTGHSSLGRLKSLPIDELKIDRSFIVDLTENDEDKTIVRSTIHLAHQMGLQVVAEGVETEEAWRQLRSMGCERAQGYLIANPLPAREIPAWLAAWNQRARELQATSRTIRRNEAQVASPAAGPAEAPA